VLTKWIAAIFVGRTAVEDQRRTIIDVKSVWHTRGLKDNGDRSRIRECIDVGAKFRRPGARLTSPNLNRGSLGIETDCPNRSVRARSRIERQVERAIIVQSRHTIARHSIDLSEFTTDDNLANAEDSHRAN